MTEPTIAMMVEIAEELNGTCGDLNKALESRGIEFNQLSVELLGKLDDEVMDCQVCGWWYETHELNDDQICNDCEVQDEEQF